MSSIITNAANLSEDLCREIWQQKDPEFADIIERTKTTHAKLMAALEKDHGPLPAAGVFAECDRCVNYDYCEAADMIRRWRLRNAQ